MTRFLAVLALVSMALPSVVLAQDSTSAPRGAVQRRVIHLDPMVITPARPTAVYFVARSRPEARVEDVRESFTAEIVAATGGAPF